VPYPPKRNNIGLYGLRREKDDCEERERELGGGGEEVDRALELKEGKGKTHIVWQLRGRG
jgi:hypothetical protein